MGMHSVPQLSNRIKKLKKEKENLSGELKDLKKQAVNQVIGLECEVAMIRKWMLINFQSSKNYSNKVSEKL
jgi:predicted  nucleic acid-binding Zn-ribbon protein